MTAPTAAHAPVPASEPVTAWLGEGQLEQILDNLLANSLDAVPAGGRIRIRRGASRKAECESPSQTPGRE